MDSRWLVTRDLYDTVPRVPVSSDVELGSLLFFTTTPVAPATELPELEGTEPPVPPRDGSREAAK